MQPWCFAEKGVAKRKEAPTEGLPAPLEETVGCLALRGGIALSTGRCGVSPLEGVMENANGGCNQGKTFPIGLQIHECVLATNWPQGI